MRSFWNGSVSFGLVNIPIKLYTATSSNDIKFNYLHSLCHTPIKYKKTCPTCNKEITEEEIVRGYEFQRSQYVIIDEADFEAIAPEKSRSIDILDFVRLQDIDPVYFHRTYYLEPVETSVKAYHLLKEAMLQKQQIAIAKIVIRSRENLAAIRVYGPGLALETMYYPDEIRAIEALSIITAEPTINDRELDMAMTLIDNLSTNFVPERYRDEYQATLTKIIEQKIVGERIVPAPAQPTTGKVIDLMAALEASVQATKTKDAERVVPEAADQGKTTIKRRRPAKTEEIG